jgi:hypothetical protein
MSFLGLKVVAYKDGKLEISGNFEKGVVIKCASPRCTARATTSS